MPAHVDEFHPLASAMLPTWDQMRHTYAGESTVKAQRTLYLPSTASQDLDGYPDGQPGLDAYNAYILRAVFPEYVREATEALVGIMHREPAKFTLPTGMQGMVDSATLRGEPMSLVLRRINEAQLLFGRIGVLFELRPEITENPYLALFDGPTIINWDEVDGQLQLVVVDESDVEREESGFTWRSFQQFRVLLLDPETGAYTVQLHKEGEIVREIKGVETVGKELLLGDAVSPQFQSSTLNLIPMTFIGPRDLAPEPDISPLLSLSNIALRIYRGEADRRQNLFMQGQDTFVVIGADLGEEQSQRVGAGARLDLPMGADAKYIGVGSKGLSEQRQTLEEDNKQAAQRSAQLLESSRSRESGEALSTRMASRTATLGLIALTGAAGLQRTLRMGATWMGLNPEEVIVEPSLDFVGDKALAKDLKDLMEAKGLGLPLSTASIHTILQDRDYTNKEFEEELAEISQEGDINGDQSDV